MDKDRLTELEIKLAYQEDLLQTLNTIIIDQQKQIGRLEESCKLLNKRIKTINNPEIMRQEFEIPPHY